MQILVVKMWQNRGGTSSGLMRSRLAFGVSFFASEHFKVMFPKKIPVTPYRFICSHLFLCYLIYYVNNWGISSQVVREKSSSFRFAIIKCCICKCPRYKNTTFDSGKIWVFSLENWCVSAPTHRLKSFVH